MRFGLYNFDFDVVCYTILLLYISCSY